MFWCKGMRTILRNEKNPDFNRAIIYGFGNDFVGPFVGPNKKSTYDSYRKCLILRLPRLDSNQ